MPSPPAAPRQRAGDLLVLSRGVQPNKPLDSAFSQLNAHLPSPPAPHSTYTTSTALTGRLGKLGIPIPCDDGVASDSESVKAHPPDTPLPIKPVSHRSPSSTGRQTRSEALPGVEAEEGREDSSWSETGFRDIVDDLTVQNQQLRGRLRRYEAAKIPTDLRRERLFEVRFFDGLPKQRRQEIESFLTSYVQQMMTTDAPASPPPHSDSPAVAHLHLPLEPHSSVQGGTGTTSSIGVTLRSLRSSEKDRLGFENAFAPQDSTDSGSGSGEGGGGRWQRSSPGSSDSVPLASGSGSSVRRFRSSRKNLAESTMPSSSRQSTPFASTHPPALLRRLPPPIPLERDLLASASFSGIEPTSRTGTGSGMRISDPSARKRRRSTNTVPPPPLPTRPPLVHRRSSEKERSSGSEDATASDALALLVVEMIERLFEESLPLVSLNGSPPPRVPSPPNPLHSEPHPLPAHSSSNTHYLRELLATDSPSAGHWIYLNLLLTFAGVHRLNVSIAFVRHALRTRSTLIEVSDEGNKVRWTGPATRVLKPDRRAVGEVEQDVKTSGREHEVALLDASASDDEEREQGDSFKLDSEATGKTTAATSVGPTMGSKNPSTILSGPRSAPLTSSGSVQDEVPEYDLVDAGALGVTSPLSSPRLTPYVPLFGKRAPASLAGDESDDEASPEELERPQKKRRKTGAGGGVIFFNSDRFCSDLAGDAGVRDRLLRLGESPSSRASTSTRRWTTSRPPSPLSRTFDDSDDELALEDSQLMVFPCEPFTDAAMSALEKLPLASLSLSGMSSALPADHFTLIVRTVRTFSPARCALLQSRTIHHLPTAKVRFPRLDDVASPSRTVESDEDYGMSLALPVHEWSPVPCSRWLDSDLEEEAGREDEMVIDV